MACRRGSEGGANKAVGKSEELADGCADVDTYGVGAVMTGAGAAGTRLAREGATVHVAVPSFVRLGAGTASATGPAGQR